MYNRVMLKVKITEAILYLYYYFLLVPSLVENLIT